MAERDNLVGAPASGFGQTVSFAFNPDGRRVQATEPARRVAPQGGVQGGQRASRPIGGAPLPDARPDPTVQALMKMGEAILAPKLKAAQQAKFVEGMSKAAAGQAMADIVEEQPWYADFFGDTDVVEGARAYHSQASVAQAAADLEAAMPELRTMPPAQAQAEINKRLSSQLTGDDSVDAHILGATAKMLPGVLRQHAKAHYSYLQEEASKAESSARLADAELLQSSARGLVDGTIGAMEYDMRVAQTASRARPAAGRNLESYAKTLADDLALMARKGQLHAINAYRSAGYLDALPADLAKQVETAVDTAENTQRAQYSFEWGDDIAALKFRTIDPQDWTPRRYFEQTQALNTRYKQLTGSTRDLVGLTETVTDMEQMGRAIHSAEEKLLEQARKQREDLMKAGMDSAAKQVTSSMLDAYIAQGDIIRAKRVPGARDEDVHAAVEKAFVQKGPEVLRRAYMMSAYVNPLLKAQFTAGLRGNMLGELTEATRTSYAQWRALRDQDASGALAAAYFADNDADKRMEIFHVLSGGNLDSPAAVGAFKAAFVEPLKGSKVSLSKEERKQLTKDVVGEFKDRLPAFLGGKPGEGELRDDMVDALSLYAEKEAEVWRGAVPGIDNKRAAQLALKSALANGVNVEGGYVWKDSRGQPPLQRIVEGHLGTLGARMPADPTDQARLWRGALDGVLGEDAKQPLGLMRDTDGGLVAVIRKPGEADYFRRIPAADLAAKMRDLISEAHKPTTMGIKQESLRFGPEITYKPAPGARSIYDGLGR